VIFLPCRRQRFFIPVQGAKISKLSAYYPF
jgi:hypothetical protein